MDRKMYEPTENVDRAYQATSWGGGGCVSTVRIADSWEQLQANGWGGDCQEIERAWFEAHNERIFEALGQ